MLLSFSEPVRVNTVYVLSEQKWMPLAALSNVGHDSREYTEKDRAGIFYAQSWLLTHVLMLSRDYADKFPNFATEISDSGSEEAVFSKVYGKTLARMHVK
jgi:hypothetical protein